MHPEIAGGTSANAGVVSGLCRVWDRRSLLASLVVREVRTKYAGTALGLSWMAIEPLLLIVFYTFLFGIVFQVRTGGAVRSEGSYPLFLLGGLVPWLAFSNGMVAAARSVAANKAIITKVVFPVELLPMAAVASAQVAFLVMTAIVIGVAGFAHGISLELAWIPVFVASLTLMSLGFGYLLAVVITFFKDVSNVVPFLVSLWMYGSPVVYPTSAVPESLRGVLLLNPVTPLIEAYRRAVVYGEAPALVPLAASACVAIAIFLVGFALFKRAHVLFAEVL